MCLLAISCTISLFIYHLVWCDRQGVSIVWTSHRGRWGGVGKPQGDVHKSLIRHKQQIFSYWIEEVVSLKSLHHNIRPDIDPACPTSNSLNDIVIESSWMGAIRRPCSIQAGRAKMLFARLCACRLFWHSVLTKLWWYTNQSRFGVHWNLGFGH